MKHNTNKSWGQVEDKMRHWGYFWLHWWNNKGDLPLSSRPPNGGNSTAKIRTFKRTTKQRSSFPANWKRKGDNEATARAPPPKAGAESTIFTSHLNFLIFNFPTFRPVTASTLSASTLSAPTPDRSHRNARIFVQNRIAVNYATHRKKTPKTPNMSLICVLPRITETAQKTFYLKSLVFRSTNCA